MSAEASRSDVQQAAEQILREWLASEVGVPLRPASLELPDGARADVDAVSEDLSVIAEVYARVGALKGGNFGKIAKDALKLITLRRLIAPKARLIILLADDAAAAGLRNRSWLASALQTHSVEVLVAPIDDVMRAALQDARHRQRMINPGGAP